MRRWLLVTALTSVAALGQTRLPTGVPSPETYDAKALANALRGATLTTATPTKIANVAPSVCAIPLTEVPVNRTIDRGMQRKLKHEDMTIDNRMQRKAMPACRW